MKRLFEFLQQGMTVVILALFFGGTVQLTKTFGPVPTWFILITSAIIFALMLWCLLSSWHVEHQGYIIANTGSSGMGFLFSLFILLRVHEVVNDPEMKLFLLISFCFGIAGICFGVFIEWCVKPWKEGGEGS